MKLKYGSRIGLPITISFILAIGYLDYSSGFKFSLFPLYLVPIAVISWNESLVVTIFCSCLASIVMIAKDVSSAFGIAIDAYFIWGISVKVLIMMLNGYIFWKIRNLIIEKDRLNLELQKSLLEINELREMIPICAWCHSVRNDKGFYEKIETYLSKVTGSKLTHGICPSCAEKFYGDFNKETNSGNK